MSRREVDALAGYAGVRRAAVLSPHAKPTASDVIVGRRAAEDDAADHDGDDAPGSGGDDDDDDDVFGTLAAGGLPGGARKPEAQTGRKAAAKLKANIGEGGIASRVARQTTMARLKTRALADGGFRSPFAAAEATAATARRPLPAADAAADAAGGDEAADEAAAKAAAEEAAAAAAAAAAAPAA
jgi:hypothetical protein